MTNQLSTSPDGTQYPLPKPEDYDREFKRIKALVSEHRALGQEIVVVLGVGFVGAVMAAIVADVVDKKGKPSKFVLGVQRPSTRSFWKIPTLNKGISPVKAEDPEVEPLIRRTVLEKKSLLATYNDEVLALADVVVVDVQLDFLKEELGNCRSGNV
ncbi:MAG: GDP-mannose dehydrogenase, partial [Candidatus Aminicenantes bacterium]|nr:GDP-mannose dehydrogenase [Candidatus Aminicenantes bacterium]